MPNSLVVFAVSFMLGTPNFGTFGGVAHLLEDFYFLFLLSNCVYAHISNLNYKKYLDIKKNRIQAFQSTEPP